MIDKRKMSDIYVSILDAKNVLDGILKVTYSEDLIRQSNLLQSASETLEHNILPPDDIIRIWIDRHEDMLSYDIDHMNHEEFSNWIRVTVQEKCPLPDGIVYQCDWKQIGEDYNEIWREDL